MASSNGGVPPGFRFHPTDEELLHYYLRKKISFQKFDLDVIREVDLNKIEPWDLQESCRIGSTPQNEWYFFSHKDRKYPTGSRTNRATSAGFWKATGRDKFIRNSLKKIGMRKTLVFYRGRAPHGQKTDWIMHEYRLEDTDDLQSDGSEDGWVVCRVFKKKNLFRVGNEEGTSLNAHHHQLINNLNLNTFRDNVTTHHPYQMNRPHTFDLGLQYSHYNNIQPQNFLPNLSCESGSESLIVGQVQYQGVEVGTCEQAPMVQQMAVRGGDEWTMMNRLVTSHLGDHHEEQDSSKGVNFIDANASSVNQINQLPLRGEMDFWGYAAK
ncbi:hypothetical protein GIB67_033598 [Kingdonia uniflora]|uniref:NAC domain-containing protein n=1 Tax=Kingdonia uniflora TaxID=39325 RepID=A0A7J7LAP6_9MAGN|nr:hypothetical protein GIB67_033598 [Kingdonia uniflora]